jgi:antirestriction protein
MSDYNAPARTFLREQDPDEYEEMSDEELNSYIDHHGIHPFKGDTEDYARDLAESAGGPLEAFTNADYYFDYESFGRDLKMDDALTSHLQEDLDSADDALNTAKGDLSDYEDARDGLKDDLKEADAEDKADVQQELDDAQDDVDQASIEVDEAQEAFDEVEETIASYDDMPNHKYAEEWVDQMGGVSELGEATPENYFDYASVARDMDIGGDTTEFEHDGDTYTVNAHW